MSKYYLCKVCGNIVEMVTDSGAVPHCCNQPMMEQKPGTTDASSEKHVPVIELTMLGQCIVQVDVSVGAEPHPSEKKHYIEWIELETTHGNIRKRLGPDCKPKATFYISSNEKVLNAYAYCNLHGLWIKQF